uniref:Amine oxidase domain-containing protein n=1 Tax=Kalmanozyma brasiliensis (strain GHG001) TaxID=1365824 RepID=V5ECJ0_KALBG
MSIPSSPPPKQVRVAIVGSGLTGLVATYLLTASSNNNAPNITVDIFERASTLGMDSASISVPLPLSSSASHPVPVGLDEEGNRSRKRLKVQPPPDSVLRIDVPMRAFTGGYYPQLLALYRHLGVQTKKTNFTYSFASLPSPSPSKASHITPSPNILYNGANGFRGLSLPFSLQPPRPIQVRSVLEQVSRVREYFGSVLMLAVGYLQLLILALWHHHLGHTCDVTHPIREHTLRDLVRDPFPRRSSASKGRSYTLRSRVGHWVERGAEDILRRWVGLDEGFAHQTLTPLFSAVMTSTLDSVWSCPASEVLDYIALTLGKDHFVVKDGVRTVVAKLLREVEEHGPFDHIIFATQANQTAHFLRQYIDSLTPDAEAERLRGVVDVLERFKYEKSLVVNHTDRRMLPRHEGDWRDLNLVSPTHHRGEEEDEWESDNASNDTLVSSDGYTMATHILTLPPTARELLIMQTTNPLPSLQPDPAHVLSRSTFERAVIDVEAHVARQGLFTHSPKGAVQTAGGRRLALGPLQAGAGGVWVCGSWAVGIPLLEGCVVSAQLVAEEILTLEGATIPAYARW